MNRIHHLDIETLETTSQGNSFHKDVSVKLRKSLPVYGEIRGVLNLRSLNRSLSDLGLYLFRKE